MSSLLSFNTCTCAGRLTHSRHFVAAKQKRLRETRTSFFCCLRVVRDVAGETAAEEAEDNRCNTDNRLLSRRRV